MQLGTVYGITPDEAVSVINEFTGVYYVGIPNQYTDVEDIVERSIIDKPHKIPFYDHAIAEKITETGRVNLRNIMAKLNSFVAGIEND